MSDANHKLPSAVRALAFGLAACIAVAWCYVAGVYFYDQMAWQTYYQAKDVLTFEGDRCQVALGNWAGSFAASPLPDPTEFKSQRVPMRGTASMPVPSEAQYLVTRCRLPLGKIQGQGWARLALGPAFGESQCFVNGKLQQVSHGSGDIEVTLGPEELRLSAVEIELRSHRLDAPVAGLASLIPPYLSSSRPAIEPIDRFRLSARREQAAFRFAVASCIMFFALGLIVYGLRYRDLYWFVALAGAFAANDALIFLESEHTAWSYLFQLEGATNFVAMIALVQFHWSILRLKNPPKQLDSGALSLALLGVGVSIFANQDQFFAWRLLTRVPSLMGIALLGATLCYAFVQLTRTPPASIERARQRKFALLGCVAWLALVIETRLEDVSAIYLRPLLEISLLLAYAAAMTLDLVKRQKLYFEERNQRQQAEHELAKASAIVATARMVAHDVRRPFNLIKLFSQGIQKLAEPRSIRQFAEEHLPDITRAQLAVDGVLQDLVHAFGEPQTNAQDADIAVAVREAMRQVQATRAAAPLSLTTELAAAAVQMPMPQLTRILANLLENAFDAMNAGGTVRVTSKAFRTKEGLERVEIQVNNSGSYIPENIRAQIFELGFTSGKPNGSGLGLAAVRQMVRAQGGDVHCQSDREDGTSFRFDLPAGSAATSDAPMAPNEPKAIKIEAELVDSKGTLVVVDDDGLQQFAWKVAAHDAEVLTYALPEELIQDIARLKQLTMRHLCFVLDFNFEGSSMKGDALAKVLKEHFPNALILISTDDPLVRAMRLPAVDRVVDKSPVSFGMLASA